MQLAGSLIHQHRVLPPCPSHGGAAAEGGLGEELHVMQVSGYA